MWKTLEWPRHFTKRGGVWVQKATLSRHFSLKCPYQSWTMSGHVFVCKGCGHVFVSKGCGHVFVCKGCGHVFVCKGCGHVFLCKGCGHVFVCKRYQICLYLQLFYCILEQFRQCGISLFFIFFSTLRVPFISCQCVTYVNIACRCSPPTLQNYVIWFVTCLWCRVSSLITFNHKN